jgi:hypothetical protein
MEDRMDCQENPQVMMQDATLRDWYAGMVACAGVSLASSETVEGRAVIAARSYALAEALMLQRQVAGSCAAKTPGLAPDPLAEDASGAGHAPGENSDAVGTPGASLPRSPGTITLYRTVQGPDRILSMTLLVPRTLTHLGGWEAVCRQYFALTAERLGRDTWGPGRLHHATDDHTRYTWVPRSSEGKAQPQGQAGGRPTPRAASFTGNGHNDKHPGEFVIEYDGQEFPILGVPPGVSPDAWWGLAVPAALTGAEMVASAQGRTGKFLRTGNRFVWHDEPSKQPA